MQCWCMCMQESRAVLRDDSYVHSRLHIRKAISVHFTSFTGSTPRTSSREVRSTQCIKKDLTKKIATENKCWKIEGNASGMCNMEMTGCV